MARPQKYNREQVLQSAMQLFWRQGYNATNLPQLLETTELSRSSFYAGFSDKRKLFIECFEHYNHKMDSLLSCIKESNNPAEAIYYYNMLALKNNTNERANNGCLVVNSLLEFEDIDDELHQLAQTKMQRVDNAFEQCFLNAIKQNKLDTPLSPEILAKLLGVIIGGLHVKKRAGLTQTEIKAVLNAFIVSIGATPFDASSRVSPFSVLKNNNKLN